MSRMIRVFATPPLTDALLNGLLITKAEGDVPKALGMVCASHVFEMLW